MTAIVTTITISAIVYDVYGLTADPVQDATDYFGGMLGADVWTAASTLQKQQAIITAAQFLDRGVGWSGTKTDLATPQPREWPRDGAACSGTSVDDGTTPDNIALAEFELALSLLTDSSIMQRQDTGTVGGTKALKAGSAEVEYFYSSNSGSTRFPTPVHELMSCYTAGSNATAVGGYSYGTADVTTFCDDNRGPLGRPYP